MTNSILGARVVRAVCSPKRHQGGAVAVLFLVMAAVLIGVGGFVVDFSRAYVMRNELQNAADSAALAAAGDLYRGTHTPDWARAEAAAATAVGRYSVEGTALSDASVAVGWWNLDVNVDPANPVMPVSWTTGAPPSTAHGAVVRVTVTKGGATNGGPMSMTLGRLLGSESMGVSATGYAVIARPPSSIDSGYAIPFAVSSCLFESGMAPEIWNSATTPGTPVTPPVPFVLATGATHGSQKNCSASCHCGQWTTFSETNNSASYTRDLIEDGNPSELSVGDDTYIQPGTEATLYGTVNSVLRGKNVAVPIVSQDSMTSKGFTPILGFACVKILAGIQGGNVNKVCSEFEGQPLAGGGVKGNKCVIAQFSEGRCSVSGEPGSGPSAYQTTMVPPRLIW